MLDLKVSELLKVTGGKLKQGSRLKKIKKISTDTRTLQRGDLFIALKGEKFDGHNFVKEAFKRGASGVVIQGKYQIPKSKCQIKTQKEKIVIIVDDTLKALQQIAKYHRRKFNLPVIAITGSTGKTTTKEILSSLLKEKFLVLKTPENYNNEIGIPLTLLNLEKDHQVVILEMAMRAKGEIRLLTEIAEPNLGLITNIGQSHRGRLGSIADIAQAKGELLKSISKEDLVVLNKDDPWLRRISKKTKAKVIFYGIKNEAEVMAGQIQNLKEEGWKFNLKARGYPTSSLFLPLLGEHNIYNALAALSIALSLGLNLSLIKKALSNLTAVPARLEMLPVYLSAVPTGQAGLRSPACVRKTGRKEKGVIVINDTYNSSPASLKSALLVLKEQIKGRRKIAVLGDMCELGEEAVRDHQEIGRVIAHLSLDLLLLVGDLAKFIAQGAKLNKKMEIFLFQNNKQVISKLRDIVCPGDAILVKGSRVTKMEEVVEGICRK